jgi:predicted lipoprotein with Yx(FWY)xxD motif
MTPPPLTGRATTPPLLQAYRAHPDEPAAPVTSGATTLRTAAHRRRPALAATITAAGLCATACGGNGTSGEDGGVRASAASDTASASVPPAPPSGTTAAARGFAVTTADSAYGTMLFDQPGQAIYLFERETTGRPECYADCAIAWPPVLTTGTPQATGGVRADLLGTTPRDDGGTQVTYAGHPLYYYAHEGLHQVLCHDVTEFGGRWLVVTPEGVPAP